MNFCKTISDFVRRKEMSNKPFSIMQIVDQVTICKQEIDCAKMNSSCLTQWQKANIRQRLWYFCHRKPQPIVKQRLGFIGVVFED